MTARAFVMRMLLLAALLSVPKLGFAQDAPAANGAATEDVDALAVRVRAMKPRAAGMLLAQLPAKLSADVLLRLTPHMGGRILNHVPPVQAAAIAAEMAGQNNKKKKNKEAS